MAPSKRSPHGDGRAKPAEAEIAPREEAVEGARRRVASAARDVVLSWVDVGALLDDAQRVADALVTKRAVLSFLQESLPDGDARRAVARFLSEPFLRDELTGSWRNRPDVAPWREAIAALHRDPDTALPAIENELTVVVLPANGRD